MAVDDRITNAWSQMVAAANNYAAKNLKQLYSNRLNADPYAASRAAAAPGDIMRLNIGSPDSWTKDKEMAAALGNYQSASRTVAHEQRGLIPQSPAPDLTPETRGTLKVDLDTSPVQTKDSVMYRNAGDGEESTIGEASRPNKRKPGLSSNLGINL